jgi:RNA polymerase sigma-70 factor (ECF subfamily)
VQEKDTVFGPFPTTRLSLIDHVDRPDSPEHRAAWEAFFDAYWPPLYAYLRRSRSTREEALDLLQDFFLAGVEGKIVGRYDPAKGKFRTYLLVCLTNLRRNALRKERVRPDRQAVRIGSTAAADAFLEGHPAADPEWVFEEEWRSRVAIRGRASLEARLAGERDQTSLRILSEWVFASARPAGSELAAALGITPGDLYTRATRLRQAFAAEVEREVRAWSARPEGECGEVVSALLPDVEGAGAAASE